MEWGGAWVADPEVALCRMSRPFKPALPTVCPR